MYVGLPEAVAAEMWLEQIARPAMGDKDPTHILDEDTLGLTEEPVALFRLTHHGASLGHQTIEGLLFHECRPPDLHAPSRLAGSRKSMLYDTAPSCNRVGPALRDSIKTLPSLFDTSR